LSDWIGPAFYVATGLASIAGAVLSWISWRKARQAEISARNVATEARRAVRSTNAAEALKDLNQSASELLDFIQNDRAQAAAVRARDLFSQIGAGRMRWRRFLDNDEALGTAQEKVRKVSLGLTADNGQAEPEVKQKLLTYCHSIIKALSDESSKIIANIEQAEEKK
jgi:hypothetical protein